MAGHSRSKNGVARLCSGHPRLPLIFANKKDVDARDKRGHDGYNLWEQKLIGSSLEGAVTKPNSDAPVLWEVDGRGVAQVVLNRPERNNAYDGALIQALLATLDALAETRGLRAVVISGRGRHFQAGADLKWIDAVRAASREENIALSRATAQAIWRLNAAPVPTVALVQGACFGGGTGLDCRLRRGDRRR